MNAVTDNQPDPQPPASPVNPLDALRGKATLERREVALLGSAPANVAKDLIRVYFDQHTDAIDAIAATSFSRERFIAVGMAAIRANPDLRQCSVATLFASILKCAELGLEPNTDDGHIFLIPRRRGKPRRVNGRIVKDSGGGTVFDDVWEVQVQLGWKGMVELAYRSPRVLLVKTVLVYANDLIDIEEGTHQVIEHRPLLSGPRGAVIGAYAVVALDTGRTIFEWMRADEIRELRDRTSDAWIAARARIDNAGNAKELAKAQKTPWITDEGAMFRKSVMRRIWNLIPKAPEVRGAPVIDGSVIPQAEDHNAALSGIKQAVDMIDDDAENPADDVASKTVEVKTETKQATAKTGEQQQQAPHDSENPDPNAGGADQGKTAEDTPASAASAGAEPAKPDQANAGPQDGRKLAPDDGGQLPLDQPARAAPARQAAGKGTAADRFRRAK